MPAIAAAEVQKGVAKLRRAGGIQRADRLERWLESLLGQFDERILVIDTKIARRAGEIEDAARACGRNPGLSDILIAATAAEHDLIVLTANTRHFQMLDAAFLNPLLEKPGH